MREYEVIVLHNVGPTALWKYGRGDRLALAHSFRIVADDEHDAAEAAWKIGNVDAETALGWDAAMGDGFEFWSPQVRRYRQQQNRSLSMGDVCIITAVQTAWAAKEIGWEQLDHVPGYAAEGGMVLGEEVSAARLGLLRLVEAQRRDRM